jgi:hypothetical protein
MNEVIYPNSRKYVVVECLNKELVCYKIEPNQHFTTSNIIVGMFDTLEVAKTTFPQAKFPIDELISLKLKNSSK